MLRRLLILGCLGGVFLAGTFGCGKDEKPVGSAPSRPRLPKPPGQDKKPDPKKP